MTNIALPADYQRQAEWVYGRLMYPQHPHARFGRYAWRTGSNFDWTRGFTSWTQDYPRADRHFAARRPPSDADRCTFRRATG